MKKHKLALGRETVRHMQADSLVGVVGGIEMKATYNMCKGGSGTCGSGVSRIGRCGIPNPSEICATLVCSGTGTSGSLSGG